MLNKEYVTVHKGLQQEGTILTTLPNYVVEHQKFYLRRLGMSNEYVISTFCGMVLDCFEEGNKDGTLVVQWKQNGKAHQIWIIEECGTFK